MSWLAAFGMVAILSALAGSPAHAAPASPVFTPCGFPAARCGHIVSPLDPAGHVPGTIPIGFALFSHHDPGPAAGTIVATEGGPGFPTSGSRAGYLGLFGPLLADHDLLLIDNRGTGGSGPIDCHVLETMPPPTVAEVGACGRSLGAAADFYGTPLAADDMAAVLDALGITKIDLYGDSYGTFTAQIFAQRHSDRLRSLVLDGAFAARGASGFVPNTPAAIRRNVDLVCARSAYCHALPGTALGRLDLLIGKLRASPIHGTAPDGEGRMASATLDPAAIGTILYNATYDRVDLRELDAAVRAMLDDADALPLLRLAAETNAHADSRDPAGNVANFSYGLFAAVSCMDYPQLYDMTTPPSARRAALETVLAAKRHGEPELYAPLTIDEWRHLPLDYSIIDLCLDWPVASPPYSPGQPVPPTGSFSDVPTLVLSGELDSTTPPADADLAATAFPNARHLLLANSFHVDAIDDEANCAAPIVRHFVRERDPGDTTCADRIPPVPLVSIFARHAAETPPAEALADHHGSAAVLSVAATAVETAADVLDRAVHNASGRTQGLRGGTIAFHHAGPVTHGVLTGVRWAEDLPVSGKLDWDQDSGWVTAVLKATGLPDGGISIRWNAAAIDPRVSIASASPGGSTLPGYIHASMPAP